MSNIVDLLLRITGSERIVRSEKVQTLWSGYGEIIRYHLQGYDASSVIVKHIRLAEFPSEEHPRGWNSMRSHERKLKSYQVEQAWYTKYADQTSLRSKVPKCLHTHKSESELILIMEDLNASGFARRLDPSSVTLEDALSCLTWLASFHARFIGVKPHELWEVGTYWHLDTRPDEWARMNNEELKHAAREIDKRLSDAQFQTIVHGDAKLANFCFGSGDAVAAVDFQYVGGGCGMKDVAYFISSCFDGPQCQQHEGQLLDHYFAQLSKSLDDSIDMDALRQEWMNLYKYAWADFYRFLDGWSPEHWKMHDYSMMLTNQVLNELQA